MLYYMIIINYLQINTLWIAIHARIKNKISLFVGIIAIVLKAVKIVLAMIVLICRNLKLP